MGDFLVAKLLSKLLFKSKHEKDLLRRMEPPLLMCVLNDSQSWPSLAMMKAGPSLARAEVIGTSLFRPTCDEYTS